MLRVIAVDDEVSALKWFHRIASEISNISVIGEFQYAEDAIKFVRVHEVDAAFLDIEMPEIAGLELAEQLTEINPYIHIIFVTAYNQYALEAFKAHAIGYLLKPLDREEFAEQIDILESKYNGIREKNQHQPLAVKCFGQFTVCTQKHGCIRWKTAKAEELFALLIHAQGKIKSKESLIEILWPNTDINKAANLFRVTCTYIRSSLAELGIVNLLQRELDGYKLNTNLIKCDLYGFRLMAQSIKAQHTDKLEEVSALYAGEYLEGKNYDWAISARVQLESDFLSMQRCLAERYIAMNSYEKACKTLEQVLQYDPYEEEAVFSLIKLKLNTGNDVAAVKVYRQYESLVKEELGILPSDKLRGLLAL